MVSIAALCIWECYILQDNNRGAETLFAQGHTAMSGVCIEDCIEAMH